MVVLLALIGGLGCGDPQPSGASMPVAPATRESRDLDRADKVGAADFDGDGVDEIVLVQDGVARFGDHAVTLGGEVQVVQRGDPQGTGREVLLLGTGMGRSDRSAPIRIWSLSDSGPELLLERDEGRNQVADLDFVGDRIWAALFGTGKAVDAGWVTDGSLERIDSRNLATAWLPLDGQRRVVGRVYGDRPKAPGDLRVVGPEGERVLPTLRGVRALSAADLDGDGHDELLVGDGWHYAYGKQAIARIRVLQGPDWTQGRTIAMFDDEYTVWSLHVIGDRVLATGSRAVHWLARDGLGWADARVAPVPETGNAVPFRDADGLWALVSGSPARLVPLD